MICASEQSVIVLDDVYEDVRQEFFSRGAYFLNDLEKQKIRDLILINGRLNPEIVGQSVAKLAQMSGLDTAKEAKVLIAEVDQVGTQEPLSYEKLSPILAMYRAKKFSGSCNYS